MVFFRPHALAIQTRFRWRVRNTEPWARLMDATCFPIDFITRPRGPDLSSSGGHWSHILTCAHVTCPWEYPNFYPPVGATKWVSRVTMPDTLTQVRMVSRQGKCVYRHFTSQQHTFVHTNPRLDVACIHPEQGLKRSGEMKMLWLQNEGFVLRPRFEMLEELRIGDYCWVYAHAAELKLFDEDAPEEPYMIPVGIRCRVKSLEDEHFFLEIHDDTEITMGMCGAPVMRHGKCVGMLTALVHEESENKTLAGTAMCTYAHDLRAFVIEVEKQMKNSTLYVGYDDRFMKRRREEGVTAKEYVEWDDSQTRLARHIPVPMSQWEFDENWATEEDRLSATIFSRTGPFNVETQENNLGMGMEDSNSDGMRPEGINISGERGEKPVRVGDRPDPNITGIYAPKESWKDKSEWDTSAGEEFKEFFLGSAAREDAQLIDKMRRSVEAVRTRRQQEDLRKTAVNVDSPMHEQEMMKEHAQRQWQEEERRRFEERRTRHSQRRRPFGDDDDTLSGLWDKH